MDEKHYHAIADATLMHCFDQLEPAFEAGLLEELDLHDGILSIEVPNGRIYLISKHRPTTQIWFASPVSGGWHYDFSESEKCWRLADGRTFYDMLRSELNAEGVKVVL